MKIRVKNHYMAIVTCTTAIWLKWVAWVGVDSGLASFSAPSRLYCTWQTNGHEPPQIMTFSQTTQSGCVTTWNSLNLKVLLWTNNFFEVRVKKQLSLCCQTIVLELVKICYNLTVTKMNKNTFSKNWTPMMSITRKYQAFLLNATSGNHGNGCKYFCFVSTFS